MERDEKWPREYADDIFPLPKIEWREAVLRVPAHFQEMVRAHLRVMDATRKQ